MGIYDRDWFRGEQKSPNDNKKVSREDAERLRRMVEGASPNEPPKVEPKYRFEFAGSLTGSGGQPSNGYDPTYGCGYESSSTVKQGGWYKNPGLRMKLSSFIILVVVIGYLIAVSYNVISISKNLNDEFLSKNSFSLALEVGSRLGLAQTLGIIGNALTNDASIWQNSAALRELNNVLFDWYAPIKWLPVLSVSKQVGWLVIKSRAKTNTTVSKPNTVNTSSYDYAYVKSDALNVRSGPSANYKVLAVLSINSKVQVINKTGTWWKIKYGNIEGYVHSEYLSDKLIQVNEAPRPEGRETQPQEANVRAVVTAPVSPIKVEPGYGTTRSWQYQREWEEAYELAPPIIPGNLVLPSGETVDERVRSGKIHGR